MFFADRIKNIKPSDRVLEVGPGARPHPRADVLLEKRFSTEAEALGQRGRISAMPTDKPIVYFDGGSFPFRDKEFGYVICSHVLEHVADIESFCGELTRVAERGYIEFPTIYYDYLYDIPEHVMLLFWNDGQIYYLPKAASGIKEFCSITGFFFYTLQCGHDALVQAFKPIFFQGFEWSNRLTLQRAKNISEVCWPLTTTEKTIAARPAAELAVLIFSKDRAMQLDALLASLYLQCRDPQLLRPHVLFACSTDRHEAQYCELAAVYPQVTFIAETDFAVQVSMLLNSCDKILFMVDDTLVVRGFSAEQLGALLDEHPEVVGVSLRLGRNTDYCYPLQTSQLVPQFESLGNGFLRYDWSVAAGDFAYPLEVSSSCYRTQDILQVLTGSSFRNPNELEGVMAINVRKPFFSAKRLLLCSEQSRAFSYPINIVQTCCRNRCESSPEYTAEFLADLFAQGRRIAVAVYRDFLPNACHQPVELHFR